MISRLTCYNSGMRWIERLRRPQFRREIASRIRIEPGSLGDQMVDKCLKDLKEGFIHEVIDGDTDVEDAPSHSEWSVFLSAKGKHYWVTKSIDRMNPEESSSLTITAHYSQPILRGYPDWIARFWPDFGDNWDIHHRTGEKPEVLIRQFMDAVVDPKITREFFAGYKNEDFKDSSMDVSTRWPRFKPED